MNMRYKTSEHQQRVLLKQQQMSMAVIYGFGMVFMLYNLIVNFNNYALVIKLIIVFGIIACPVAWVYFSKKTKANLLTEFEVSQSSLNVYMNNELKKQIPLSSIQKLTKIPHGYRIESNYGDISVRDDVEGKEELLASLEVVEKK